MSHPDAPQPEQCPSDQPSRRGGRRPSLAPQAWPPTRQREVVARYAMGASSVTLAQEYGTNPRRVLVFVRRWGGRVRPMREACRRHAVDEDFFARVDSEVVAYVLGFLLADGCVRVADAPVVSVALALRDVDHLETIRRVLGAEHPVGREARRCHLHITSSRMVADLIRLGVTPRKSLTAVPPSVPRRLERHFWRGVVDGDGCLSLEHGEVLNLVGTRAVLEAFRAYCARVAPGSRARVHPVGPNRPSCQYNLTGARALKVVEQLYENATIALPRKAAIVPRFRRAVEERLAHRRRGPKSGRARAAIARRTG